MAIGDFLPQRMPIQIPACAAGDLVGFRAWVTSDDFPERWKATFLNGAMVLDISPEETETHNKVKLAIQSTLWAISIKERLGTMYGDGVQLSNKVANLSTVPDAMFVSRATLRSGQLKRVHRRGRPGEYIELEGTPDLVVEVVSRSSRTKDTQDLPILYYCAGIPEYWLIDALEAEIDFQVFRREKKAYGPVEAQRGWLPSQVFGRRFKLVRERDEDGDWQYDLKVKK